jgi:hypothetical protein
MGKTSKPYTFLGVPLSRPVNEQPKTLFGIPIVWSDEVSGPPEGGSEMEAPVFTKPNYYMWTCLVCDAWFSTAGRDDCPFCREPLPEKLRAT